MTALRALCLDLDDTILDEQSSTEEGWRRAAAQWAEACPQDSCEAGLAELALAREWYWADAARERLRAPSAWHGCCWERWPDSS